MPHIYRRGRIWWIEIIHRGERFRMSTGSQSVREAEDQLDMLTGLSLACGTWAVPFDPEDPGKTAVELMRRRGLVERAVTGVPGGAAFARPRRE